MNRKNRRELDSLRNEITTKYKWQSLRIESSNGEQVIDYRRNRLNQIAKRMGELHG